MPFNDAIGQIDRVVGHHAVGWKQEWKESGLKESVNKFPICFQEISNWAWARKDGPFRICNVKDDSVMITDSEGSFQERIEMRRRSYK